MLPPVTPPGATVGTPSQPSYNAPPQAGYSTPQNIGGGAPSNKGTIALILGISSILLDFFGCCCLGIPSLIGIGLGIAAFIMGKNELEDIAGGFSSADGEGMAKAARIIGMIGAALGVLCFLTAIALVIIGQLNPH